MYAHPTSTAVVNRSCDVSLFVKGWTATLSLYPPSIHRGAGSTRGGKIEAGSKMSQKLVS